MTARSALVFSPGAAGPLLAAEDAAALSWQDQAACREADPRLFFPEGKGGSMAAAKRVCAVCPVRADCLGYALAAGDRYGVYGGLSPRERRRERAVRREAAPAAPRPARAPAVIPDLYPAEVARFRSLLAAGGCGVTWPGRTDRQGRGLFTIRRDGVAVPLRAHRVAYKLATGVDPAGMVVAQECGDSRCLTPGCLAAVTRSRQGLAA